MWLEYYDSNRPEAQSSVGQTSQPVANPGIRGIWSWILSQKCNFLSYNSISSSLRAIEDSLWATKAETSRYTMMIFFGYVVPPDLYHSPNDENRKIGIFSFKHHKWSLKELPISFFCSAVFYWSNGCISNSNWPIGVTPTFRDKKAPEWGNNMFKTIDNIKIVLG